MTITGKRLVLRKGTDLDEVVTITDPDTGDPLDVTSDSFTCRLIDDDGTAVLSLTVGSGITITNGTGGIITIAYGQDDIAAIATGDYRRYLLMAHGGDDSIPLESQATILPSVGSV